jgi:hypothetical protein
VVEDKEAIRELLHRYCFYMDEGRFTELAALFTDDGEWIAPYRTAKGPADIAAWLQLALPASPVDPRVPRRHGAAATVTHPGAAPCVFTCHR